MTERTFSIQPGSLLRARAGVKLGDFIISLAPGMFKTSLRYKKLRCPVQSRSLSETRVGLFPSRILQQRFWHKKGGFFFKERHKQTRGKALCVDFFFLTVIGCLAPAFHPQPDTGRPRAPETPQR